MDFLRKCFLPWTAGRCFPHEEAFLSWLQRKHRRLNDVRAVFLLLAAAALIAGYALDRYLIMVLAVAPLAVVLLLSLAIAQTEIVLNSQNKTEPTAKE